MLPPGLTVIWQQSRVRESIDMVQAVQDLKVRTHPRKRQYIDCTQLAIQSIDAAVNRADWETATRHVQRAMAIDPKIVNSRFAEAIVVRCSCMLTGVR
jgi:hypothetical protein